MSVVENGCDCGKVIYVSRRDALTAARRMERHSRQKQQYAYRCCDGNWHLTSKSSVAKTRRVQNVPTASLDQAREARQIRRQYQRQKDRVLLVVPPRVVGKTACVVCGRLWLSDISPVGRVCPGVPGRPCGGVIRVAKGDPRDFKYERAA